MSPVATPAGVSRHRPQRNASPALVDGKVFNAGYQNLSPDSIAEKVREVVGSQVEIAHTSTDDNRSYHISSGKIERELGFIPRFTIEDAFRELTEAFRAGKVTDPLRNPLQFSIKRCRKSISLDTMEC